MTVASDFAALAARVLELEARPICRCGDCIRTAREQRDNRERDLAHRVRAMPPDEREAWIRAASEVDLDKCVRRWTHDVVDVAVDLPEDLRARLMRCSSAPYDHARLAVLLDDRAGKLRPRVRVAHARRNDNQYADLRGYSVPVDQVAAFALRNLGVRVHQDYNARGQVSYSFSTDPLVYPSGQIVYTEAHWEARLKHDARMRACLDKGFLVVEPLTRDEVIGLEVAERVEALQRAARSNGLQNATTGALIPATPIY